MNKNEKKNIVNNIIMDRKNNEEKKDITGREVKRQTRRSPIEKLADKLMYEFSSVNKHIILNKLSIVKLNQLLRFISKNKSYVTLYPIVALFKEKKTAVKNVRGNRYTGRVKSIFNRQSITRGMYRRDNRVTLKRLLGVSQRLKFNDYVTDNYLNNATKLYACNVKAKISFYSQTLLVEMRATRTTTFIFRANPNLTNEQLRAIIWMKTDKYFNKPMEEFSDVTVEGISFNIYPIPENFNIGRTRLFLEDYLKLNELEQYKDYEVKENCVLDYLDNELSKIYAKHTRKQLIERMKEYEPDFETAGFELFTFQEMMKKYYPNVKYLIISPTYNLYEYYNDKQTENNDTLIFYFNNNHLYGITNEQVKKHILNNKGKLNFLQFNDSKYEDYIVGDDFETENTNYILPADIDYNEFKNELIEETKHGIEYFNKYMFKHPTKNILIHPNNDYENRKLVYEKLNLGEWNNQSYPSIALELLNSINSLTASNYNKESFYYLSKYHTLPIIDKIHESRFNKGIDINLHYSSIFYEDYPKIKIPIYDFFNVVKPYKNEDITLGEYFIEEFEIHTVKMGGCFYHYETVKYLLDNKHITKQNIKYAINTNRYRTGEQFKDLIDITKQFDRDTFKKLNNMLNGMLNNNYHKINKENFYTESLDTFIYLLKQSITEKYEVHFEDEDEHYYLSRHKKTPNYQNTSSYYRTTLSLSLIRLIKLIEEYKQYKIVMIKTDCLFIETDEDIKLPEYDGHYTESMGKYKPEKMKDIEVNRYKPKPFIPYEKKDNITLLLGSGGLGKSYKVIKETDEKEKTLLLCPTNASLINLINKTIKIKKNKPLQWKFSTVALLLETTNHNFSKTLKTIEQYDNIILDEAIMSSTEILRVLVCSKKNVILMGDNKQLLRIPEYNIETYDIMDAKQLFNIRYKKFVNGKSRYDRTTYDIINKFVKTGIIPTEIKQSDDEKINDNVFHIVSYNNTRKKITKEITKSHNDKVVFKYQNKCERYGVCQNMPIISTTNKLKKYNIFNNWTGTLKSFNNNKYVIHGIMEDFKEQDLELDDKTFKNNFIPFYASTIHKFQGQTLNKNYYIHDVKSIMCSKNSLYTSLSRCNNYKQITIIGNTKPEYTKDTIQKEQIDMKPAKKEVFIYSFKYECNHRHKNIEAFNEEPDIDCKHTKTLLKHDKMDKKAIERFIYNIKKEKAIDTKKFNLNCFKVKKKRVQNNRLIVGDDYLMLKYYIDNERKSKKIRFKKIGLEEAQKKMNDFIKENNILIS